MTTNTASGIDLSTFDARLVRYGLALEQEHDLMALLARVLFVARDVTKAEAGTIFLIDGDVLRFTIVQNDFLKRRVGDAHMRQALQASPLPLNNGSLAGFVALTGKSLNIADVYRIPADRPYHFDRRVDSRNDYRTRSLLALPIADHHQRILGVLQLINALDTRGRSIPFGRDVVPALRWFAAQAAAVIPNLFSQLNAMTLPSRMSSTDADGTRDDVTTNSDTVASGPLDDISTVAAMPASERDLGGLLADHERGGSVGRRLGDLLLADGVISLEQLAEALAEHRRTQQRLGAILVRFNYISEAKLMDVLSKQYHLPLVSLDKREISADALRAVPAEMAKRGGLLPIERWPGGLKVAIADPTDLSALDDVAFTSGLSVTPVLVAPSELFERISECYDRSGLLSANLLSELQNEVGEVEVLPGEEAPRAPDVTELRTSADETPVVRLVNAILLDAIKRGASDIHLESFATTFRVRFRIDGALLSVMTPAKRLEPAIVSRIKIMASLDIAEHRMPQDGRAKLRVSGREIDLRVSIIPTIFGESVDIRLLDGSKIKPDPALLGLGGAGLEQLMNTIGDPNGVILVTGPTGSGKTTTLYSLIHLLNERQLKVLTVEDPVEYVIDGVNQVHVREDIGRTFGAALRSFLRHDPDVILVGEMRDHETAEIAIRAGLTGHLVLSTLHTNDAASTIARLLDMGIPPFLLSSSLRLIVAQRLLRQLCHDCRRPYEVDEQQLEPYGLVPEGRGTIRLYKVSGCSRCNNTGFRGRSAIFEVLPISSTLRPAILSGASVDELRSMARRAGMQTLRETALARLVAGDTTLEEVVRTTTLD
jgi:type IV pilus assembly protein PilB